jgi:hypothetical protein
MAIPVGAAIARPFLPARNFEVSKAFYRTLGFTQVFDGELAIFRIGDTGFFLQNLYSKAWAEMCVMQLAVDDVPRWWRHIESLGLAARFDTPAPRPPKREPWGLDVAYLWDPCGVLWHISSRPADPPPHEPGEP